jgi:hypothetical protein
LANRRRVVPPKLVQLTYTFPLQTPPLLGQALDAAHSVDARQGLTSVRIRACHEGNYAMRNILSAARTEDKQ